MVEAGNALRTEAILHVIHQEISPDVNPQPREALCADCTLAMFSQWRRRRLYMSMLIYLFIYFNAYLFLFLVVAKFIYSAFGPLIKS